YAQVINDVEGKTLFSISTQLKKSKKKSGGSAKDTIVILGKTLGEKFKGQKLVLDRNGFLYHGKVKFFADAVREAGGVL
ncbi:MAG: 50S ribosomal protein L18, partial [Deltaproteobacteria bacterium]|nr:50S ribosomal protein L18 [Deltaproteobacteria bacterium]